MKISKNIIIPIAAIVILGLYLIFNTTGKMNYRIPEFNSIESGRIDSIQIKSENETVNLYSDNGIWKLNPDNLRAESSKINEMLIFLENPQFIDMVSDTKNYQNYGLEDKQYIDIKALVKENKNNNTVRELYLGDLNENKRFAFIRRPDNRSVFTVKENIKKLFDVTRNDLLDKKILDFDSTQINKIEVISNNTKTTIDKSVDSDNKDIWKTDKGAEPDSNAVGQSLRYLANSRFESYSPVEEERGESNIFTINLYTDKTLNSFTITKKNDSNYSAYSSYAGKDFILAENTATQIIKMSGDILKPEGK